MSEPIIYIGIVEVIKDGNLIFGVGFSQNSEDFTGKFYQITAEEGEGSCKDLLLKLKKDYQNVK